MTRATSASAISRGYCTAVPNTIRKGASERDLGAGSASSPGAITDGSGASSGLSERSRVGVSPCMIAAL